MAPVRHCHVKDGNRCAGMIRGDKRSPLVQAHRYPVEIIDHCVWLYFRFTLSFREVEEMMLARGVVVSYEDDPALVRQVRTGLRRRAA